MSNLKDFTCRTDLTVSELKHIISETPMRETDRQIAELRYCHDKTYEEIAEIVYCDWRTVRSRLIKVIAPKLNAIIFRF